MGALIVEVGKLKCAIDVTDSLFAARRGVWVIMFCMWFIRLIVPVHWRPRDNVGAAMSIFTDTQLFKPFLFKPVIGNHVAHSGLLGGRRRDS